MKNKGEKMQECVPQQWNEKGDRKERFWNEGGETMTLKVKGKKEIPLNMEESLTNTIFI